MILAMIAGFRAGSREQWMQGLGLSLRELGRYGGVAPFLPVQLLEKALPRLLSL